MDSYDTNPEDWGHSSYSSEYESLDGDPDEDRNILRSSRQSLALVREYVQDWGADHAIREFYQNWKDAIIETFSLQQTELQVVVKGFNVRDVYIVEARHPKSRELLGFIRFQSGVLEFTNFNAQLSRQALDIGVTTKRDNKEAAGTHGEGFKLASLVMARRGYRVQFEASKYYWTFKFDGPDKNHLYCSLSPMAETKLMRLMNANQKKVMAGATRELQSHIWEDVSVKIGRIHGIGEMVGKEDFLEWAKVSLDLNPPSEMVLTRHGCLILDKEFGGKLYLKGLLLEGNTTKKPLKFGYNLFQGYVDRDRQRLSIPAEEAKVLAEIWADAIRLRECDTIDKYVALLLENQAADVHGVENYVSKITAQKIWQCLLRRDPERKCFHHDSRNGDKDVELIRNSLRLEPKQLPRTIWVPLRRFKLVRTPQEQQCHLLHNAPIAEDKCTPYSAGVERALRAALALDRRTKDLEVVFRSGTTTDLDLMLFQSTLEINDKWLDFKQSHSKTACWLSRHDELLNTDHFSCDHVVTGLYELILEEITRHPEFSPNELTESNACLYQRVCDNLRQMPRMVESCIGLLPGEISVSWVDLEGDMISRVYGLSPRCQVTLHRESTCSLRRTDLLAPSLTSADPSVKAEPLEAEGCGCPSKIVPRKDFRATFEDLDYKEEYFPMVSREDPAAFFGMAPKSLRPNAPPLTLSRSRPRVGHSTLNANHASSVTYKNEEWASGVDLGDIYNENSSDEGEIIPLDPPIFRASSQSLVSGPENGSGEGTANTPTRVLTPSPNRMANEPQKFRAESLSQQRLLTTKDQALNKLRVEIDSKTKDVGLKQNVIHELELDLEKAKQETHRVTMQLQVDSSQNHPAQQRLHTQEERLKANDLLIREVQAETAFKQQKIAELQDQPLQGKKEMTAHREQTRVPESLSRAREASQNKQGLLANEVLANLARIRRHVIAEEELQKPQNDLKTAKATVENLNIRDQDANASIDNLRSKIQESQQRIQNLEDENEDLKKRLEEAEDAYDQQLQLAARAAARRRASFTRVKRERDNDRDETPESSLRRSKRPRTVITTRQAGAIDLTGDGN